IRDIYVVDFALAAFLAAFLAFAQRAFWAAAILAFASGLRIRFFVTATLASFFGRPGARWMEAAPFIFAADPRSARTSRSRDIS
ncbi:MAG TPA: hypothetical protein VGG18_06090, partial [Granulicella sp.]